MLIILLKFAKNISVFK